MDATTFKNMQGAAGYKAPLCVEDLFNTVRYNGKQSSAKSVTGVGFKPDMVIIKNLSGGTSSGVPLLYDSVSGPYRFFYMNGLNAQQYETNRGISSFDDDGFSLASMNWAYANEGGNKYVASCWKKEPYFFDIVEYSGTGSAQNISHNLGCTPGMMWVFQKDYTSGLAQGSSSIWHKNMMDAQAGRYSFYDTGQEFNSSTFWNNSQPTSTVFSVGSSDYTNQNGKSYIAYIFAGSEAKFGPEGGECIASVGRYNMPGSASTDINIEPDNWGRQNARYVLNRKRDSSADWEATDSIFGLVTQGAYNSSGGGMAKMVEYSRSRGVQVEHSVKARALDGNPYGFSGRGGTASQMYIYYAIVQDQKIPKTGAEVFGAAKGNASPPAATTGLERMRFDTGVRADMVWRTDPTADSNTGNSEDPYLFWTLRTMNEAYFNMGQNWELRGHHNGYTTEGEKFDLGFSQGFYEDNSGSSQTDYVGWSFKKARNFFATSMWKGNNASTRYVAHNLGKAPEFMWIKCTNNNRNGDIYFDFDSGNNTYERGNMNEGNNTTTYTANDTYLKGLPNSSWLIIGDSSHVNTMTSDYVACLFSSCPGVCKIGKYTGTGSNLSIDCGFESQARYIMIKRIDADESYMLWDYARGIHAPQTPTGSTTYTTAGSHTFTVPAGVNSVSFAAIGAGGAGKSPNPGYSGMGGGGGGGAYKNGVSVSPGDTFGVCVGSGGPSVGPCGGGGTGCGGCCGGNSYVTQGGTKIMEAQGGRGGGYASQQAVMLCGDGGGGGGYNMGGNGNRHDSAASAGYGHYSAGSGGYGAGGGGGNGFSNNGKWMTAMNGLGVYDQNPPNPSLAGGQGFNGGQPGGNASNKCAGYYGAGGGGGRYGNPGAAGARGAVQAMWGAVYPNLSGDDPVLFWDRVNDYHPEYEGNFITPTNNGFQLMGSASYSNVNGGLSGAANASGGDYWYMAIS